MYKKILVLMIFIFLFSHKTDITAEEGLGGMEDIKIFSDEDFKETVDTTKIKAPEIDYSMLDETYIVAKQTKDIEDAKSERMNLWKKQLSENNPAAKKDAILLLGKIKDKKAVPELINIVRNKAESEDIRLSAAWALGNMANEIMPEIEKISYDTDLKTRIYGI